MKKSKPAVHAVRHAFRIDYKMTQYGGRASPTAVVIASDIDAALAEFRRQMGIRYPTLLGRPMLWKKNVQIDSISFVGWFAE